MSVVIATTAVVDPRAQLGEGVRVGHFSVIGPDAKIGDRTLIEEHVVVTGHTTIGEHNHIVPGTVSGAHPQDTSYKNTPTKVIIGDNNVFREHVTVNRATEKEDGITEIGNDNFLMASAHVAHDCRVGDRIVLANNTMLGGHARIGNDVTLAGGSGVSHFASVGQLSFVSAMARVLHDVPPFTIVDGQPARARAVNTIGLKRHGYTQEDIKVLNAAHKLMYRARVGLDQARETIYSQGPIRPVIKHYFDCIARSYSGNHGRGTDQRGKKAA